MPRMIVPPATSRLDEPTVMAALGHTVRWEAVKLMVQDGSVTAAHLAGLLGRDYDGVSKHLRILRAARVAFSRRDTEDARKEAYYIPDAFRPEPGIVDFGFARLDFRLRGRVG